MHHQIRQYPLESGSLEVEYLEQNFGEFPAPKTAAQIQQRLAGREHLILISLAPCLDEPDHLVPVAFKVGHELTGLERDPSLLDLGCRLNDCLDFARQRVFYSWLGGTRREFRGQGHYRALTEQQELWAQSRGYRQFVVKTKNRFHAMRTALDHLQFDVLKFERDPADNANSKLYLHKPLSAATVAGHLTRRMVIQA